MIDQTISAATSASNNNPVALTALALIELSLAAPVSSHSEAELDELIDKWGRALQGVDAIDVDRLTTQLKAVRVSLEAPETSFKQAS